MTEEEIWDKVRIACLARSCGVINSSGDECIIYPTLPSGAHSKCTRQKCPTFRAVQISLDLMKNLKITLWVNKIRLEE